MTSNEIVKKEFEELFANRRVVGDRTFKDFCDSLYEDILEWHLSALEERDRQLVEGIRKAKKYQRDGAEPVCDTDRCTAFSAYNSALDTAISIITSKKV